MFNHFCLEFDNSIFRVLSDMKFIDVIDFLVLNGLVALLWFSVRKSKVARNTMYALLGVAVATGLAMLLGLSVMSIVLGYILKAGAMGAVTLYIFRFAEQIAKVGDYSIISGIKQFFSKKTEQIPAHAPIEAICQAAVDLARTKTGGLIVIERKNRLDDLIHTGVDVDAAVSPYLIRNIFYEGAPLHDGALIIRGDRIFAAGCILPITHRVDVDPDLGTRHRAAIGTSENSDAVIVVISEESGAISVACDGVFIRGYDGISLKAKLIELLDVDTAEL